MKPQPHCPTCQCIQEADYRVIWKEAALRLPEPLAELARSVVSNRHRVKMDTAKRTEP